MKKIASLITIILLTSCSNAQFQPANPDVVARIVSACTQSGLFKAVDGTLSAAVPAAALPIMLVNAGVDKVCSNPTLFASDISTVEWVVKNLATVFRK